MQKMENFSITKHVFKITQRKKRAANVSVVKCSQCNLMGPVTKIENIKTDSLFRLEKY
jgi:hypothetical protein